MPLRLKGVAPKPGETDRRYYMIDVQEGGRRVRLSSGTRNKALAERREQAVVDALRDDPAVPHADLQALVRGAPRASQASLARHAGGRTLKEACQEALNDPRGWGRRATRGTYETNLKSVQAILGETLPVAQITDETLDKLDAGLQKIGNSTTTVNRKMFALLYVLKRERKLGNYPRDVPEWEKHDEKSRRRTFVMTVKDEEAILDQVLAWDQQPPNETGHPRKYDGADYHDLFVFLADVGCRLSQAFLVRWRDLVDIDGRPHVRFARSGEQKGGKTRTIPLTSRVVNMLEARRHKGGKGPFAGLTKRRAEMHWDAAKSKTYLADEPEAVIHSLRHTCATRLLELTDNLKLVQEWLGHTDITTTGNIYAHVSARSKATAVDLLDRVTRVPELESNCDWDGPKSGAETMVTH